MRTYLVRAVLGLICLAVSTPLASSQDAGPIKIGLLIIDSGPFATMAKESERAARIAVDVLNREGGALGRKFDLVIQSHAGSPASAVSAATKLAQQAGVTMITGAMPSSHALALSPKLSSLNVILIDGFSQTADMMTRGCAPNYFRVTPPDPVIAAMMKTYVAQSGAKTWNLISADYASGHTFAKQFSEMVDSLGGSVQQSLFAPQGTADYGSYISQLAAPAQGLMVTLYGSDAITFAKQQKQFGLFDKYKVVLGNGFAIESQFDALGDTVLGVVNTLSYHYTLPGKRNADYVATFSKQAGRVPYYGDADTMVGLELYRDAVIKSKTTEPAKVREALEGLRSNTIYGDVEMRAADHHLLRQLGMGEVVRAPDGRGVAFKVKFLKTGPELYPPPSPECKVR